MSCGSVPTGRSVPRRCLSGAQPPGTTPASTVLARDRVNLDIGGYRQPVLAVHRLGGEPGDGYLGAFCRRITVTQNSSLRSLRPAARPRCCRPVVRPCRTSSCACRAAPARRVLQLPPPPAPPSGCWPWYCRAAGGGRVRAGGPERGRPGYLGRRTHWTWSAGPRSAWRSRPRWTWWQMSPVTAAAGLSGPPEGGSGHLSLRSRVLPPQASVVVSRTKAPAPTTAHPGWRTDPRARALGGVDVMTDPVRLPLLGCVGRALGALGRGGPSLSSPPPVAGDANQDR
jgi:hypothetical protein